jgi:hypothetical protein
MTIMIISVPSLLEKATTKYTKKTKEQPTKYYHNKS